MLDENPDLKEQFEAFINEPADHSDDDLLAEIQQEANEFAAELEALNISDPDWEDYIPRHNDLMKFCSTSMRTGIHGI